MNKVISSLILLLAYIVAFFFAFGVLVPTVYSLLKKLFTHVTVYGLVIAVLLGFLFVLFVVELLEHIFHVGLFDL